MAWLLVFFAAVVEVFWVIGLKYSDSFLDWAGTLIMIIFSFVFVIKACEKLPPGTVYAVFTGLGAAAIVLIDFIVFGAEFSLVKVLFIGLIVVGVIGIKVTTDEPKNVSQTQPAEQEGK